MCFYKGCENIKKDKLKIIITFSIILLILFSGYCLAKYKFSKEFSLDSKIAVPVLEVEGTETTKISEINNIGYYDFSVKNYNEKNISDVSQNYTIEIISNTNEAVEYELYKEEEQIELNDNKTDNIFIEGSEEKEHHYRLKITYDENKKNSEEDILEDVQVKIHSEQDRM